MIEEDLIALEKDRQKKDTHNQSKNSLISYSVVWWKVFSWTPKKIQYKWQNQRFGIPSTSTKWTVSDQYLIRQNLTTFLKRFHEIVKDVRQNKGSILRATVEYVKVLKKDQLTRKQIEGKCKVQEFQNKKLLLLLQVREFVSKFKIPTNWCWS